MKFLSVIYSIIFIFSFFSNIYYTTPMQIDFTYYHKSTQIDELMTGLIKTCTRINIKEFSALEMFPDLSDQDIKSFSLLKYYDITTNSKMNSTNDKKKQNIFLLGGEHPRELISTELLLKFVLHLCNSKDSKSVNSLMSTFNFRIVLNANPNGRAIVEKGEYCRRTNLQNVDINRNWNIFWSKSNYSAEENPGTKPFSEIETQFVLNSIKDFNAKLFLTIHSGVYGLYFPYAYLETEGILNKDNMLKVLTEVQNNYCSVCQVGTPSKLIGYKSSGTCLDYIYDNFKVPYSLAWEIYSDETLFPELNEFEDIYKASNSRMNMENFIISSFVSVEEKEKLIESSTSRSSNKLRTRLKVYSDKEKQMCVSLFNPLTKPSYEFIINNWLKALLHLFDYVKNN